MKGTRHSEEQIIAILKQGEAGLRTPRKRCGIKAKCWSSTDMSGTWTAEQRKMIDAMGMKSE
jgi:hypothetical protein